MIKAPSTETAGRIVGAYTYLLLCRDEQSIYIKIGVTEFPERRFHQIRNGCPVNPVSLSTIHVPSRRFALKLERTLHAAMAKWRVSGEWFRFKTEDKPEFNSLLGSILREQSMPLWPFVVKKLATKELTLLAKVRQVMHQRRYAKSSRAYQDFCKHSGKAAS